MNTKYIVKIMETVGKYPVSAVSRLMFLFVPLSYKEIIFSTGFSDSVSFRSSRYHSLSSELKPVFPGNAPSGITVLGGIQHRRVSFLSAGLTPFTPVTMLISCFLDKCALIRTSAPFPVRYPDIMSKLLLSAVNWTSLT